MIAFAVLLAISDLPDRPRVTHLNPRQLDAISAHCHSPRSWLRYGSHGELHLRPSRNAKYQQVDCVLGELKRLSAAGMAFVSNEIPK